MGDSPLAVRGVRQLLLRTPAHDEFARAANGLPLNSLRTMLPDFGGQPARLVQRGAGLPAVASTNAASWMPFRLIITL